MNSCYLQTSIRTLRLTIAALSVITTPLGVVSQASAQTETILHDFKGSDGSSPQAELIMDSHGNLYGTTYSGGSSNNGTAFKLSRPVAPNTTWSESVLFSFGGVGQASNPAAPLIFDSYGDLYGTTYSGGLHTYGAFFRITPSLPLKETGLYSFEGGADGAHPESGFVRDSDGNLFGTTRLGGDCGSGTVFELIPPTLPNIIWEKKILHHFCGPPDDGAFPAAGLIMNSSGDLLGTTFNGGAHTWGTVFELSYNSGLGTWTEHVLHSFGAVADGMNPSGSLIMDSFGNLYGTTIQGGLYGEGTVFRVSCSDGSCTETSIYAFLGGEDGRTPYGRLVMDSHGNLYGTTSAGGGGSGCNFNPAGTVFKLSPGLPWTKTILHKFCNVGDGNAPQAGLVMDSNGNVYGTTYAGGSTGHGIVFKITP